MNNAIKEAKTYYSNNPEEYNLNNWAQTTDGNDQNIISGVKRNFNGKWKEIKIIIRPINYKYFRLNGNEFKLMLIPENELWI